MSIIILYFVLHTIKIISRIGDPFISGGKLPHSLFSLSYQTFVGTCLYCYTYLNCQVLLFFPFLFVRVEIFLKRIKKKYFFFPIIWVVLRETNFSRTCDHYVWMSWIWKILQCYPQIQNLKVWWMYWKVRKVTFSNSKMKN